MLKVCLDKATLVVGAQTVMVVKDQQTFVLLKSDL